MGAGVEAGMEDVADDRRLSIVSSDASESSDGADETRPHGGGSANGSECGDENEGDGGDEGGEGGGDGAGLGGERICMQLHRGWSRMHIPCMHIRSLCIYAIRSCIYAAHIRGWISEAGALCSSTLRRHSLLLLSHTHSHIHVHACACIYACMHTCAQVRRPPCIVDPSLRRRPPSPPSPPPSSHPSPHPSPPPNLLIYWTKLRLFWTSKASTV